MEIYCKIATPACRSTCKRGGRQASRPCEDNIPLCENCESPSPIFITRKWLILFKAHNMIKPGNIKKQQAIRSEDLQDILIAESRSKEKSIPFKSVIKKLKKKGKM